jgi:sterol desaturase/sphingolipid hydroxylase (fatty acid hydroxylase superfamily)
MLQHVASWSDLAEGASFWRLFVIVFAAGGLCEILWSWRKLVQPLIRRWSSHGALMLITSLIVSSVVPVGGVALAVLVQNSPYGFLNRPLVPLALRCIVALLLLDLVRYVAHYLMHSVSLLWRVHQVHHSDPDMDLTTGLRFHPLEVLMEKTASLLLIAVIAPPPLAIILAQFAVLAENFFAHANVSLSPRIDRILRYVIVTPNMHHAHHFDELLDQKTNLGDLFTWWDRIFGTYREVPSCGREHRGVGLKDFAGPALNVPYLLILPFLRQNPSPQPLEAVSEECAAGTRG